MLKIERIVAAGTVTLRLIGRIDAEQLPEVQKLLHAEQASDTAFDLAEVTLVDGEAVRFLARCEKQNIRLTNCPAYIREWIFREGVP
jgi:anti-anti-sigma regulatory factor